MIVDHRRAFRSASSKVELAGQQLSALGPEERLLHACFEARIGDTRPLLIRLRDIVQLVLTHDLDIERIERLSGAWGAQSLVAEAVRRAWTLLGVTDIVRSVRLGGYPPDEPQGDNGVSSPITRPRSRTLVSVQTLGAITSRDARSPGYLRAVTFPDRAYLEGHYSGHMSRWWRVDEIARARVEPRRPLPAHDRLSARHPTTSCWSFPGHACSVSRIAAR